tara:strand:+ start:10890 stop:11402 length:513 start_codon:yes stop_codon:yes gene_type:complete
MKDYRTFISEQVDLTEKASNTLSFATPEVGGASDKANTIASTRGVTVRVDGIDKVSFIKSLTDKTTYNMGDFLSNFEGLSNYTIRPEEAKAYKETLQQMRDNDPRKEKIARELQNVMTLPASADRTYRTQNVLNQLGNIATEMQSGSVSYGEVQPQTFIPGRYMNFGRGN